MGAFSIPLSAPPQYTQPNIVSEPIEGNSLTQYIRSLADYLGKQGPSTFQQGQNNVQSGIAGTANAAKTINPAVDYWTKLLSGDHSKIAEALAPEIQAIQAQDAQALQTTSTMAGRGGGRTAQLQQLPFATAGKEQNLVSSVRPQAAQALPQLGAVQGQLAGQIGQLGTAQTAAGGNVLNLASGTQLGVRGQDVSEDNANKSFVGNLLSPFVNQAAGLAGAGGSKALFPDLWSKAVG